MLALLDVLLALSLVVLAWGAMADPDLFRAVVKLITLGMVMALVWVRLQATDVALAEAAVGSGLTGALLLSSLRRMRGREAERDGARKGQGG